MTARKGLSRRRLLQATALLTPVGIIGCSSSEQLGTPALRASDPVARSLSYYPNTRDVPADSPLAARHTPEQKCSNCIHVRGTAGEPLRSCPMFPGRMVNADGWCTVWASNS